MYSATEARCDQQRVMKRRYSVSPSSTKSNDESLFSELTFFFNTFEIGKHQSKSEEKFYFEKKSCEKDALAEANSLLASQNLGKDTNSFTE